MADEHDLMGDELIHAVELLADTFSAQSIRYAVVGGLATALRGRPRFTQDVDVLLVDTATGEALLQSRAPPPFSCAVY